MYRLDSQLFTLYLLLILMQIGSLIRKNKNIAITYETEKVFIYFKNYIYKERDA